MTPAEIPLTLSADVLRLPYTPATRLVLAEIVSLYAANEGRCDASDAHFADRLTLNKDTVSVAVKLLEAEGLLVKVTKRLAAGFHRTLTPNFGAIAAKAATNPYPEKPATPTRKNRVDLPGNSGSSYPEIPASLPGNSGYPYPENPVTLPGNSGKNIPPNIPGSLHTPDDAACAAAPLLEKKIEQPVSENSQPVAAHTEGGAADVATAMPWEEGAGRTARPVLMRDSPLAAFESFAQTWAQAAAKYPDTYQPYAQADLQHYHTALLDWSDGNHKKKHDWLATIRSSMRRDADSNRLRLAGTSHSLPATTHATASSQYRPTPSRRPAQAARSGDARHPIAEGIQHGPVLTGSLEDL